MPRIVSWDLAQALARRDALVAVYRRAFTVSYAAGDHWGDEVLPTHGARAGFRFLGALDPPAGPDGADSCGEPVGPDPETVVGLVYGYTGEHGQRWTDRAAGVLTQEQSQRWLGGHFEVVEIAVDPSRQGRGIGRLLHDGLLAQLPHTRALLSTDDKQTPAMNLYRASGWKVLAPVGDHSVIMGIELPLRPGDPT
ncbi:MAG: GNAT family N-acetyltransferase [Nocardioidaceae bacterium]